MAALAVAFALGAGRSPQDGRFLRALPSGAYVVSAVRVIRFDDSVARFDTRTGEIMRFHGNLDNPSTKSVWTRHVPPVTGATSDLLEIQQAAGHTFLVDAVGGETWLLRKRANDAFWDRVDPVR